MRSPGVIIAAVLALGAVYILLPVVVGAWRRYRAPRQVRCPQTGAAVEIGLDASHAALTAAFSQPRLRVSRCAYWPARAACGQECLQGLGAHPASSVI